MNKPAAKESVAPVSKSIDQCFSKNKASQSIELCLRVAYEKVEQDRKSIAVNVMDKISKTIFLTKDEIKTMKNLKARDDKSYADYQKKSEDEQAKAVQELTNAGKSFETYRQTECDRQKHFYASEPTFGGFVYYICMHDLTKQRIETLNNSIK